VNFIKRIFAILFTVSVLAISLPSTAQTIEEIEVLAKQGNAKAQFDLANMLGNEANQNSSPDFTEVLYWLKASSAGGYAEAQYTMGLIYLEEYLSEPYGVKNDIKKGIDLITKAANQGLPEAQSKLGEMYYYGSDVPQNYSKAFEWYLKAAKQNHHFSQLKVAEMYFDGHGVRQSDKKSEEWYNKSAEDGKVRHQEILGNRYSSGGIGMGAPLDYFKAKQWYTKAADQGDSYSQYKLGTFYEEGKGTFVDYKVAKEWYLKSARQGNSVSAYNLGKLYEEGKGVRQSYETAKEWYGQACDDGYQEGCDKYKELKFKGY